MDSRRSHSRDIIPFCIRHDRGYSGIERLGDTRSGVEQLLRHRLVVRRAETAARRATGILRHMAKSPRVGEPAPDFELEGTDGPFRLSEHRGERVVLLFYPGDETLVCTRQFCSYRDDNTRLQALDATIVGISAQDVESHESFIAAHGLTIPLLADVDH